MHLLNMFSLKTINKIFQSGRRFVCSSRIKLTNETNDTRNERTNYTNETQTNGKRKRYEISVNLNDPESVY